MERECARMLVLVNGHRDGSRESFRYFKQYLRNFGFAHEVCDVVSATDLPPLSKYPLVALAGLDRDDVSRLIPLARDAARSGTGLVDLGSEAISNTPGHTTGADTRLRICSADHYITEARVREEELRLFGSLYLEPSEPDSANALVCADGHPLLSAGSFEEGRFVQWTAWEWMRTSVRGPVFGLDDLLWRSIVWAARKPFVARMLPPLVTMRVDDVLGLSMRWSRRRFDWVSEANRFGLIPWLGLFISNISNPALCELQDLVGSGKASVFPHAFGRPPRDQDQSGLVCWNPLVPERSSEGDEFIYFDHQKMRPFDDSVAKANVEAASAWMSDTARLPVSDYFLPHWYEYGSNTIQHAVSQWGISNIGAPKGPDIPWAESPWLQCGPFRSFERPGLCDAFTRNQDRGQRPVWYADDIEIADHTLFNCLVEVRDVTGYEWQPDNDVAATVQRGVTHLKRALDSRVMATLFTHETDYIQFISPENWSKILSGVIAGVSEYQPRIVDLVSGIEIVKSSARSSLERCILDDDGMTARLDGRSHSPTYISVFSGTDAVLETRVEIEPFSGSYSQRLAEINGVARLG